jgi:putative ABC transport system permease protein
MITLRIALNNLLASRRRTLLLVVALFMVTWLFTLLLALTAGVTDNLVRAGTSLSSGHVNLGGYYKTSPTDSRTIVTNVSTLKAEIKTALPEATRVVDRLRGWGKVISDNGTVQAGISGVNVDDEGALFELLSLAPAEDYKENPPDPKLTKGALKDLAKPGSIMLFAGQAKRLKVDVGDVVTIRTETLKGQTNTTDATVVAIARDLGLLSSWATFVPKETVANLYGFKPDVSGVIQIYLPNVDDSEDAMNRLRQHLDAKGYDQLEHESQPFFIKLLQTVPAEDWTGAKLDVTTWEDENTFLVQIITALRAISLFLILLLAIVIVVGISNTMNIAVRERTREIGTLRAIGMNRTSVLALFLVEALAMGALASGAGALGGAITAAVLDASHISIGVEAVRVILLSDTLHLVPRVVDALLAAFTLTLVTALAGLWPSLRAARITPVTAMQSAE